MNWLKFATDDVTRKYFLKKIILPQYLQDIWQGF